ncbi:MAG TPA: hypothetical protein VF157_02640 [Chloroflexota bacterium]
MHTLDALAKPSLEWLAGCSQMLQSVHRVSLEHHNAQLALWRLLQEPALAAQASAPVKLLELCTPRPAYVAGDAAQLIGSTGQAG